MGSLVFLFLLGFITMFILMGGPVFKIVKTTISSDNLTDEQISELYKRKPALAWKMRLFKSFWAFQQDFIKTAEWWKDNGYALINKDDYGTVCMLIKSTDVTLGKAAKKLKRLKRFWIHFRLYFKDPNDLTRKIFGENIFYICLKLNILKAVKEQLSSKPYFTTLLDKKAMSEMLARSLLAPTEKSQNLLTEILQPIVTNELVIREIEKTGTSLNMKVPVSLVAKLPKKAKKSK
jgi:hypothetical protein